MLELLFRKKKKSSFELNVANTLLNAVFKQNVLAKG